MATIRKEITISADPAAVWDALRDVGALHTRLCPGFVTNTVMDGDARVVTFGNGHTARERIVTIDDAERRLVWSIEPSGVQSPHGVAEVPHADEDVASGAGAPRANGTVAPRASGTAGAFTHHNGVAQVFEVPEGTRFVWIADLLPNELAPVVAPMMEQGLAAIGRALGR